MVSRRLVVVAVLSVAWLFGLSTAVSADWSRTYTLDADFDERRPLGVEHDNRGRPVAAVANVGHPALHLGSQSGRHRQQARHRHGKELGRYAIAPPGLPAGGNPSRTTVDLEGACWVRQPAAGP